MKYTLYCDGDFIADYDTLDEVAQHLRDDKEDFDADKKRYPENYEPGETFEKLVDEYYSLYQRVEMSSLN